MPSIGFNGLNRPDEDKPADTVKTQRVVPVPDLAGHPESLPGAEIVYLRSLRLPSRVLVDRLYYGRARLPDGSTVRFVFYGGPAHRLNPSPLEMLDDLDLGDGEGFWTLAEVAARRNWHALKPGFEESENGG